MRRRKRKREWLPWYRAHNYKGNLTEAEKRQLDAFRAQPEHPAARWDQLPEEVQNYIGRIELELHDKKQDEATGFALFWSLCIVVVLVLNYLGCLQRSTNWAYPVGALLLILTWVDCHRKWNKNSEELFPSGEGAPTNRTDEAFRYEWELNFIVATHSPAKKREA